MTHSRDQVLAIKLAWCNVGSVVLNSPVAMITNVLKFELKLKRFARERKTIAKTNASYFTVPVASSSSPPVRRRGLFGWVLVPSYCTVSCLTPRVGL